MSKRSFVLICFFVIIPTVIPLIFVCQDKWSLSITCLGSFATVATLYLAYKIFVTYSLPVDIQKKRVELADSALAFLITKRFFGIFDNEDTFFLYLTKQRFGYLEETLRDERLEHLPVIISTDFFEFLLDFRGKLEHHYFPYELKTILQVNLPQTMTHVSENDFKGKVRITIQVNSKEFGTPDINGNNGLSIKEFLEHMHIVRLTLVNFLNKGIPKAYQIRDDKI